MLLSRLVTTEDLGALERRERLLAEALAAVAERGGDAHVGDVCLLLATWSRTHLERLRPLLRARPGYPLPASPAPYPQPPSEGLQAALLWLASTARDTERAWSDVQAAADRVGDVALAEAASAASARLTRQRRWLEATARSLTPAAAAAPRGPLSATEEHAYARVARRALSAAARALRALRRRRAA